MQPKNLSSSGSGAALRIPARLLPRGGFLHNDAAADYTAAPLHAGCSKMESEDSLGLLISAVLLLITSSALASCTEVALFSARLGAIRTAVDEGRTGAESLLSIKSAMARPVMAIVIVNNISNIVGSIAVGALASDVLGSAWLGVFSAALTLSVIVFAEIIPKTVGEQNAMRVALTMAPVVVWITRLLLPAIWLVELVLKPFITGKPVTSESEIRALAVIGSEQGIIEDDEGELIQRVFRLNDVTASGIMTPARNVDWIDGALTLHELRERIFAVTHTRLPVVQDGDLEKVMGVASVRELLTALASDQGDRPVAAYAQKANFIPGTMSGDDLLRHFQRSQQHLAIVVDALGTIVGVVTLEDVMEELVGEIVDETDIEEVDFREIEGGGVLVKTTVETWKVSQALGQLLPDGKRVGEWLLEELGRIPKEGETLDVDGFSVHIADATPRRVRWVEIRVLEALEA